MNKLLLTLFVALMMSGVAFADATNTAATKARNATQEKNINSVVGVGDISTGNTVEIDGRGAASVLEYPKTITSSTGKTLNDGVALVSAAARVSTVTISGPATAAGDYILIYDAASATGTPKIEIAVGTAKDTRTIVIPGGATFSTGVFADSNSDAVFVSVTYDN